MGRVKDHFHEQIIAQQERESDQMANEYDHESRLEHEFTTAFHALLFHLRQTMADRNIGRFRFDIEARGGTTDQGIMIDYMVGDSYDPSNAKGGSIVAVVHEYCRRKGWQERNAVLAITDERPEPGPAGGINAPGAEINPDDPVF